MPASRPDEKSANQTARDATRRVSAETDRAAQMAAEVSERAARTGAEIVQRQTEIVNQAWETTNKMAAQWTQQSASQFARNLGLSGEEAQEAAQRSSLNMDAVIGSSGAIAEAMQNISREWIEFAQSRLEQNLERFQALTRCRTPQDFAAVQSELVRDNLEGFVQSARRTAEISARMADNAMRKLAESADRARRAA
jgi:phasin family protein